MGDFVTLHEEPQRHPGMPPVGRPLPQQQSHRPTQNIDVIPPHARSTRYHTGPVLTQQYGTPIIARHTRPSITPAAVVLDTREETSLSADEMYESLTQWHVVRFERFGKRRGWEMLGRIDVPETSKDGVASKVRELNRTTIPVIDKMNELDADVLHQISTAQKEIQHLWGPRYQTEVVQIEDRVLVSVKEKISRDRGRADEREHRSSKHHHHRGRQSDKRSKSRGLPASRSLERKEERKSVTAYFKTSPKAGVDLHMLMYGPEEAPARPRYTYRDEVQEEGHVRFQQPPQGLHHPQHNQQPAHHAQHVQPLPPLFHPQHRPDQQGPPQHQHQAPVYARAGDRQFSQIPQPPLQAPRNMPPQVGGNLINRGESPAAQGRPQLPPHGYPQGHQQGHPQAHQQGKPQGEQQAQYRPAPQGQAQQRPVLLQQVPPQAQRVPAQRQTEYRGSGGPAVTVVQPSHKPGILKPHPTQGLPQRRPSFTPQFVSPPGSPGTDESLVSEVFTEEEYDSDTAVSMESIPEDIQFAPPEKGNHMAANSIPPPPLLPRFMNNTAHQGMQPKQPRQAPLQPMQQQQQQQQQQRHVVTARRHSVSNHMVPDRMFAPTPPPLFPAKQRPRVDVQEIRQNAYDAGRADAREEAIIKLAERVAVAAVSSSAKPQIIIPERRHESPAPQQPHRRATLPLLPPHSGVRRVLPGMDARHDGFAPTPLPDRYESDRRRGSLRERDFDGRRRDEETEYIVEYGAGSYDSDEETYEERQRGSGVYHRSSPPPLSYSPRAEENFRRPSVGDDRERRYETVRVRVGEERVLPRRQEEPGYARDGEIEKGGFARRHERRDSGVDVRDVRLESSNPFAPRPGMAKRTTTYPLRYSRDH
ncbi:hypothetical protein QBC40DRAFT_272844 [Triangularia verruculosa]|uniref:Uncharacterized protein n=1 Tax=Triangularia verruculosa TaxID=2587418 RepID=A0AAN6XRL0_9PEZI|nr:hypothetical protein QBC40DRAFT_272844 [Triangularia verruculosa]